jgi:DNA primase
MSVAALLDRLEGVRACGPGRWVARCPAHEDRSPSLSIRKKDDGTTLLHCFSGCEVERCSMRFR